MSTQIVDSLSHRVAGISRRGSIMTLSMAGLASLAAPFSADAKKKNRKKKKDKKKCPKLEDLCAPQVEDCRLIVTAVCGNEPGCDKLIGCCEIFAACDVGAFLVCLNTPAPEDESPR